MKKMIRVFSGSCLSLDEVDHVREITFVERPHLLGPGADYFTEDGQPLRPQLCAHTLNKVFSGSALDLNDLGGENEADPHANVTLATTGNSAAASADPTISSIIAGLTVADVKASTVVLVISAGGYVGSYVVRAFLEAGYSVRAAVDDLTDSKLNSELYALHPDATRRLHLVGLDLLKANDYRDHVRGVKYVIHCGVSAAVTAQNAASDLSLIKAHTEAAQALFDAVRTYGKATVKRIVVLGSSSAFASAVPITAAPVVDETIIRKCKGLTADVPVAQARIAFVNECIRLARMIGTELTVLLPSIMLGPSVVRETSEGMRTVLELTYGSAAFPFAPRMCWNFVDVRDVAAATVKGVESDRAVNECFVLSNETLSMSELGRYIRKSHPHISAPIHDAPTVVAIAIAAVSGAKVSLSYLWRTLGVKRAFSSGKAKAVLGLEFTPMLKTVSDSVDELIHNGYVPSGSSGAAQSGESNKKNRSLPIVVVAVTAVGVAAAVFLKMKNQK